VEVEVRKDGPVAFAPARPVNELDNEHPDVNSDGVQLHLLLDRPGEGGGDDRAWSWLLVPDTGVPGAVRATSRTDDALPLRATWRQIPGGYAVRAEIALPPAGPGEELPLRLDVIVNEMPPDRERRRGQLVLSGGRGEFVYLRGDRQPADRLLPFVVADG